MNKKLEDFLVTMGSIAIGVIGGIAAVEFLKWRKRKNETRSLYNAKE